MNNNYMNVILWMLIILLMFSYEYHVMNINNPMNMNTTLLVKMNDNYCVIINYHMKMLTSLWFGILWIIVFANIYCFVNIDYLTNVIFLILDYDMLQIYDIHITAACCMLLWSRMKWSSSWSTVRMEQ